MSLELWTNYFTVTDQNRVLYTDIEKLNGVAVAAAVHSTSELSAASDEHLVWSRDGLPAVADALEESGDVVRLRSARAHLLSHLHRHAAFQGSNLFPLTIFVIFPLGKSLVLSKRPNFCQ